MLSHPKIKSQRPIRNYELYPNLRITELWEFNFDRIGCLFQGRFKAVLIQDEAHFIHLPFYLHTNPLDLNYGSSTSIVQNSTSIEFLSINFVPCKIIKGITQSKPLCRQYSPCPPIVESNDREYVRPIGIGYIG